MVFDLMYGDYEAYREHASLTLSQTSLDRRYQNGQLLDGYEAWVTPGSEGAQACHGDSGGPVLLEREGQRYVIGVVSWTWTTEHELCALGAVVALLNRDEFSLPP
jgi:secreted trypsin-like serine protease